MLSSVTARWPQLYQNLKRVSHGFTLMDPKKISNILIHLLEKSFSPINQTSQSYVRDIPPESPIRLPKIHENRQTLMERFVKNSFLQIRVLTVLFRSVEFKLRNSKEKLPNDKNLPPSSHVNLCFLRINKMRASWRRYFHSMFVETAARMDSPERWLLVADFSGVLSHEM